MPDNAGKTVAEILQNKIARIARARLDPGSPSWDDIRDLRWEFRQMKPDRFDRLLTFLDRLEKARIPYRVWKHLYDAISVEAYAPSEHWEVDFFADGDVYVERFRSNGHIDEESELEQLFTLCSDEEPSAAEGIQDDNAARK